MPPLAFRPLSPDTEGPGLTRLWAKAFPARWPTLPDGLRLLQRGYVAIAAEAVVGAVGFDRSVQLVAVDRSFQRRGIGSQLLDLAVADLVRDGVGEIRVGSGSQHHVWPGVPTDLAPAAAFFTAHGWRWGEPVVDLVGDAVQLAAALPASQPVPPGVTIEGIKPSELAEVQQFEREHFPQWLVWYEHADDVVVARTTGDGALAGALLRSGPGKVSIYWPMLGDDCGTIGCVGVRPDLHGRGIGSALVARATGELASRGVRRCHVDWVERITFYTRLGYEVWRGYAMGTRLA
jgi:beta-N-acetylhexosaminidase